MYGIFKSKMAAVKKKTTLRGIEPRSPESQSRILTIVLQSHDSRTLMNIERFTTINVSHRNEKYRYPVRPYRIHSIQFLFRSMS